MIPRPFPILFASRIWGHWPLGGVFKGLGFESLGNTLPILLDSQSLPSCVGVSHRQYPSRPLLLRVVPWTLGEITDLR